MKQKTKDLISFLIGFIGFFILILVFIMVPFIYDFFVGKKIVDEHIKEIVINTSNHRQVSTDLLNWISYNVHYPQKDEEIFVLNNGFGFYSIDNKTRLFFRGNPASWTIKTKLGRCGEDARYFVEIMDRLGYNARTIKAEGWDHNWAEYITPEGYKIVLDPSSNRIITNLSEWVNGRNLTEVTATDLDGNSESVFAEYFNQIS